MIQTAASEMLLGDLASQGTRLATIMSDSAYLILSRPPKEATGQFFIDDEVLKDSGLTDDDILKYSTISGNSFTHSLTPLKTLLLLVSNFMLY